VSAPDRGLRIGVVGIGQRADVARHAHRADGSSRVTAAADPHPRGRAHARELFGSGIATFEDHRALLESGVDAVIVATPDHAHLAPVVDALSAGVAVFVEKPLAITIADCDTILRTARQSGARLYVGHNMRHAPVVVQMRQLIQDGAIGRVRAIWCRHFVGHGGDFYFKDWHAERRYSTGLLLQKASHDLDVMHWLAGGVTRLVNALGTLAVYGDITDRRERTDERLDDWYDPDSNWPPTSLTGLNPVIDVEDLSVLNARLDNDVLISYQQCHFTPDYWRNYTVIGDRGRMENFGDLAGATVKVWNTKRSGYREEADVTVEVPAGMSGHGGADEALISEFLRFVATGGVTQTSPVAAREAVAAAYAATESLRTGGRPVTVEPPPAELVDYFRRGQPGSHPAGGSTDAIGN
jgi:predicted dehydrogenase